MSADRVHIRSVRIAWLRVRSSPLMLGILVVRMASELAEGPS
jgi:hypothetical protein